MSASSPTDAFPIDGAPFPFLREFIDANGGDAAFQGLTTDDVKDRFIVPKTQATQLSLFSQMKLEGDARIQPATWFVSHARRSKFLDLVEALEAFFANKGGVVIWLDLFSTSQHCTFSKPPEWWQQTFIAAIGQMGQMVMVMTPWDNPICLTRAWCLFELYACRSSGSRFDVAFPPAERARFLQQITERPDVFFDMLGKVDTAKSECSRDSDRERIFAAVRGLDGGFSALDEGVVVTMMEWLQRQLEEETAAAVAAGQADVECRMTSALVHIFASIGDIDRALPLCEECLEKRKRVLGEDHPDTLNTLNNLAGVFALKGEYDRAIPLGEECLEKRKRVLGEDHPDTLESLHDLAEIFGRKGEYDRAIPLREDHLEKMKRVLGEDHPDTLKCIHELACQLKKMGDIDGALPLFEECLEKGKRVLGEDHPDVLIQLQNLAIVLKNTGRNDLALPLYKECLEKRKRVLGEDHPDTITTLNSVALLFEKMDEYDRSLWLHEECLARRKRVLGEDHPDTLKSLNSVARVSQKAASRQSMAQRDTAITETFECHDYYLGRSVSFPLDQRAQFDAPLHVIAAAAARLHLPCGHPLALEQPPAPPPSGYMRTSLWPAQLQRAAIGLVVAASLGLATAPAGCNVSARTSLNGRTRILRRVLGVRVEGIQVRARWRAAVVATRAMLGAARFV
jgi:tetratricopeptide (TPR) repeat protein